MGRVKIDPKLLIPYIDRPREFVEDILFRYYPTDPKPVLNRNQIKLFDAVTKGEFISVRSGRGRGKTAGVAFLCLWFLATRPRARVVCTAPKADQLSDILWTEIAKWLHFSPLKEMLVWGKEKIECVEMPEGWFAVARTAKNKENFSGFHEEHQMFIVDESSGVPDEISETIEATQTSNKATDSKKEIITIHISNPTKITGYFYKTQMLSSWRDMWIPIHFDATDDEIKRDMGAMRLIRLYGRDHDIVQVSVFGNFPSGNPRAVLSLSDVWDAVNRDVVAEGAIEIGVDVARFGDDQTIICYRHGYKVFPLRAYKKQDTYETEQNVLSLVRELRAKYNHKRVIRIKIDDSTMGGGVVDHLRRNTSDGIDVIPCLFGGAGNDYYSNSASVMWAELKDMMGKLGLPQDDALIEELCGRNWETSLDNRSRQKIEPKENFKERIKRSPDRADALVLCCSNSQDKPRILPKLINLRDSVFRNVVIPFNFLNIKRAEIFGSVWHERDMKENCLVGLWDKETGHLTLFYEGVANVGGPDAIITSLTNVVNMYNEQHKTWVKPRRFIWYANRAMFGISDQAFEMTNIKDGPYLAWQNKHMIALLPNFHFDLNGAILYLNRMLDEHRITILPDLIGLKTQLETWVIDNERPAVDGYGLCMALGNIISMLHQTKRMDKKPAPLVPYGVTITKDGMIVQKGSKEKFLNKTEKIFAEGHQSKIKYIIPKRIDGRAQ